MHILLRRRKLGNGSCTGIQAASKQGLRMLRNDAPFPQGLRTVFRWGCTSNTPEGVTTVNSARSIHWCSDKRTGRLQMQAAGVRVPETWGVNADGSIERAGNVPLPTEERLVARPNQHAQGRRLFVGIGPAAVIWTQQQGGGYISRFIDKVSEYRVAVIQNRVAWVARKTPGNPRDVAWNVARGGRFDNVRWDDWPMDAVREALKAAKVSGTDFCGVDVMLDSNGLAYVLEVNSAPSQTSPYRQQCFAKCFDYIVQHGPTALPDPPKIKTYKSVVHPALREGARA